MNTVIIWVGVLGFVLTLVFCCVIVALRQLTVMREQLKMVQGQVGTLKEENKKYQKQGGLSSADTQQLLQQVDLQREETEELATRINIVEKEVKITVDQVESVSMQAKKNASKIAEGTLLEREADQETLLKDPSKAGLGGGGSQTRDVSAIYEEILTNLKAQTQGVTLAASPSRSGQFSQGSFRGSPARGGGASQASFAPPSPSVGGNSAAPPSAVGGGGLSLELPLPLVVYQEISSGLYHGGQFRKFEHHIRIGDGSVGDLELVFFPVKGKRRIGGNGGSALNQQQGGVMGSPSMAAAGVIESEELVFPLPSLREIKLDSDGTLPDGPSMKVLLTTRNAPTPQQLKLMGAQSGPSVQKAGGASSISKRRRDAFSTVEEVRELDELTFVFQSSCSPLLDDWVDFITAHCGDCVVYPAL